MTLPYIWIAVCCLCHTETDGNEWHKLKNASNEHPCPNCGSPNGWVWRTEDR